MLNGLNGEQIAAIGGSIVALILGLAEWARRSANKAVAPVSGTEDNAGIELLLDHKRVDLMIAQLGAVEVSITRMMRSIDTSVGAVDRNSDAHDRLLRAVNRLQEIMEEARNDLKDHHEDQRNHQSMLKRERDEVRDELHTHRVSRDGHDSQGG